ncbi:MAG: hypothetical protein ACO1PB_04645 [Ramlibacter sp.]
MGKASRAKRERRASKSNTGAAALTSRIEGLEPANGLAFEIQYLGERMSGHELAMRAIVDDDLMKLELLQVAARAVGETILDMEFRIEISDTVAAELSILEVALAHGARACLHFLLANCEDRLAEASNFLSLLFANAASHEPEASRFAREFLKENYRRSRALEQGGDESFTEFANELGFGAAAASILGEIADEERAEDERELFQAAVPAPASRARHSAAL